jgi:lipoprotein-releasing system ATP-binding protein
MPVSNVILSAENISKRYADGEGLVIKNISLEVKKAEFVAILGPSGSGKSTFLHICGLLDYPTSGKITIDGKETQKLTDSEKTNIRLLKLGFVYQYHHLLQEFSALENVMMPQLIAGVPKKEAKEKSITLLSELGLDKKVTSFPSELSGGQKQRVAIARALANDPMLLLADEPTGNLDHETSALVFTDLLKMMQRYDMSAIIVTHNRELLKDVNCSYVISEGHLRKSV